jgi:hypothetical protein
VARDVHLTGGSEAADFRLRLDLFEIAHEQRCSASCAPPFVAMQANTNSDGPPWRSRHSRQDPAKRTAGRTVPMMRMTGGGEFWYQT